MTGDQVFAVVLLVATVAIGALIARARLRRREPTPDSDPAAGFGCIYFVFAIFAFFAVTWSITELAGKGGSSSNDYTYPTDPPATEDTGPLRDVVFANVGDLAERWNAAADGFGVTGMDITILIPDETGHGETQIGRHVTIETFDSGAGIDTVVLSAQTGGSQLASDDMLLAVGLLVEAATPKKTQDERGDILRALDMTDTQVLDGRTRDVQTDGVRYELTVGNDRTTVFAATVVE